MWLQEVKELSLRDARRELMGFLTRALEGLERDAQQVVAGRLCVLRGFATGSVAEKDAENEDALVRAAADGTAGAAGIGLMLKAGAATGGLALWKAARYGQSEAVAALIDHGIKVDFRAKVPSTPKLLLCIQANAA